MDLSKEHAIIGVAGAGTMGSGIALVALYQGFKVILQDSFPGALDRAREYIEKYLMKKGLGDYCANVRYTKDLAALAPAAVVIEAVIENLDVKRELFGRLESHCSEETIFATNTSTLAVSAIAAALNRPQRLLGLHFFNPAPILPLVEVVQAAQTAPELVAAAVQLVKDFGKTPVVTKDTPGFIVNRVARPYYGEALRLLGEGVASIETIDKLSVAGAGFRMGPFALMDLIGIDINATAMQSMYEQTYGEPRYRPHPIQMQKMQAGLLGRKTGRGFYEYGNNEVKPDKPIIAPSMKGAVVVSEGNWAPGLQEYLSGVGLVLGQVIPPGKLVHATFVTAGQEEYLIEKTEEYLQGTRPELPVFVQVADTSISELATQVSQPERLVGFDGLFFATGSAVTLVASPSLDAAYLERAEEIVRALGKTPLWVKESPALVLPRIVFQLVNEAAFAVLEGVADADTVDLAMQLGVNYPKGLLAWGREVGYGKVVTVLDHLYAEYHEERYRACVLLRRWARYEERPVR